MKQLLNPFGKISQRVRVIMVGVQVGVLLLLFQVFHSPIVPAPSSILSALMELVGSSVLYENLISSLGVTVQAMVYSILITMLVVYLSVIPFFKPMAFLISKFRYLTLTGLVYLFTIFTSNMGELKLSLLMFGIVPFFVTSFMSVVCSIPQNQIDKAMVNRKTNWETLYEIIVIGRMDQLIEVMRQNFAISWMMITTVEAYDMSGGGIGTLLIKSNKHLDLPAVFAMLIIVLSLGLFFDWALSQIRVMLFKYI
jgi:sulfonate transport system permease protein